MCNMTNISYWKVKNLIEVFGYTHFNHNNYLDIYVTYDYTGECYVNFSGAGMFSQKDFERINAKYLDLNVWSIAKGDSDAHI